MKKINLNSELNIDEEIDAGYLYLNSNNKNNKVITTNTFIDDSGEMINIDFDSLGSVIGIEFNSASKFFK